MEGKMLRPNVVSLSTTLGASEKGMQWQGALGLLLKMTHQLLTLDKVNYGGAISTCENCSVAL